MKYLFSLACLMNLFLIQAQTTKASTTKGELSQTTTVEIDIMASPETVWALLTDAANYPSWNSTIIEIKGDIAMGEKIKLKSTLAPKKTFKLTVLQFDPNKTLVWGDKKGKRTFTITPIEGGVHVVMSETIGGKSYPMWAKYLPDFDESFDQFVADLKAKAED